MPDIEYINHFEMRKLEFDNTYTTGSLQSYSRPCIGYLLRGIGKFFYNGNTYFAEEGDLIYIAKDTKYYSVWYGEPEIEFYSISFDFVHPYAYYDYRFQIVKNFPRALFDEMIANGMQFMLLGSGDKQYEDFFNEMKARYPEDVGVYIGFNQALSKRVYAGADIFLMPSQNEPCGLSQMIATRYATIPVVRETGGLKDSIKDFGEEGEGQCGYTFKTYNAHDMLGALLRAKGAYENKTLWLKQMRMCLKKDFSWKVSAEKYIDLFKNA